MLALFLNAVLASDPTQSEESYWQMWQDWHAKGDRWLPEILNADEHNTRFEIFKDNVDKITRHNQKGLSWTMGLNQFADMTGKEFKDRVVGNVCADDFQANAELKAAKTKLRKGRRMAVDVDTPSSLDWVSQGKVTPVKNQKSCGSCWAFSTTGAIESRCALSKGTLTSLSEQELVDCDTVDHGCNGGSMQNGFDYAESHSGLCTESSYSYTAVGGSCQSSSCTHYDAITDYSDVPATESGLEAAVQSGPVSIAIEADQDAFQLYSSGVMSGSCGTQLDHGVLLVGYDSDNHDDGGAYWKVKNSWGSGWGESGYIRMCKNCYKNGDGGQCGLALDASYPIC